MSADEYWHGSPELTRAYRKAYILRKEEKNWELWLQGLYFNHALNVALSNAFDKHSRASYPEEPFELFQKEKTQEELEEKSRQEAIELKRRLDAFAERFNGRQ